MRFYVAVTVIFGFIITLYFYFGFAFGAHWVFVIEAVQPIL